ncbi:MAG TPA: hypothetical protein VFG54_03920 [Prolixibacteraceae bacterium]|nr:hypothetical protein [Prolixibacteraceae bacterium]
MNMKRNWLLLLLVIGLWHCTLPKYIVQKQSEMVKLDLDQSITNFIPLDDADLMESKILDSTYILIAQKKFSKLNKYIRSLEKSGIRSSDLSLSNALLLISKKQYSSAAACLEKIPDSDYPLLKDLLLIDMDYELSKINGSFNYNRFLKSYQQLTDTYPENTVVKKIVAIRLRYVRYNY